MKSLDINDIVAGVTEVRGTRHYWFFRTNGGDYYESFLNGGYIGIGYNKIAYSTIKSVEKDEEGNYNSKLLSPLIKEKYGDGERHPNLAAAQLVKFVHEIKKGDIILIPSFCSQEISFGEVLQTPTIELEHGKTDDDCPYLKRKKVNWLKTISRDNLDPFLYKLMFTRHIISTADGYGEQVDRLLTDFYVKNGKAFLILDVTTREGINARELFQLGNAMLDLLDGYSEDEGLGLNTSEINIKLNVQSPGIISLSGGIAALAALGLILVFVAGGKFTIKSKLIETEVTLETAGIIDQLVKYMKAKQEVRTKRAILEKALKDMKIKSPEAIESIIQKVLE